MENLENLDPSRVTPADLTDRQRSVLRLVDAYVAVAAELPSAGYLARRLGISRGRAYEHLVTLRRKGWCTLPGR